MIPHPTQGGAEPRIPLTMTAEREAEIRKAIPATADVRFDWVLPTSLATNLLRELDSDCEGPAWKTFRTDAENGGLDDAIARAIETELGPAGPPGEGT